MNKKTFVSYISPKGLAKYPRLDQPYSWNDSANRNMPDPEGQFETALLVPEKEAQPMIEKVKEAIAEAGIKPKHLPYKQEIDKETDEPTGNIEFRFKAYGKSRSGEPNQIRFFDAKGRPVPSDIYLTSGSTIRCLGYISVAKMGCRLNLREVQIIDLIEREASGFDAVEGSFVFDADAGDTDITSFETDEETNSSAADF